MNPIFTELSKTVPFTGDLKKDVHSFLSANDCPKTADHCMDVGKEARRVAILFNADPAQAEKAGWLHDISAVFPNNQRLEVAKTLGIDILPEEERFPMILHQKISKVMAKEIFHISHEGILDAVGCHTTLRAHSSQLDQVLFVADKIAWDQSGEPPYIKELEKSLEVSLTLGAYTYINYLWERRETLKVLHPWLEAAYEELKATIT